MVKMMAMAGESNHSSDRTPAPESAQFCQPDVNTGLFFLRARALFQASGGVQGDIWFLAGAFWFFVLPGAIKRLIWFLFPWLTVPADAINAVVWLLGMAVGAVLLFREYQRRMRWHRTPLKVDESARVVVFAVPGIAKELAEIGDEFFEPAIFMMSSGILLDKGQPKKPSCAGRRGWITREMIIAGLGSLAIGALVFVVLKLFWSSLSGHVYRPNYLAMAAAAVAMRLPFAMLRPSYLRFVPGRVDVIRYRWLGRNPPEIRSYDLRAHRVRLWAWGLALELPTMPTVGQPDAPSAEWHSLLWSEHGSYANYFGSHGILRAALMATLSSKTPPPLPPNDLVG